MSTYPAWKSGQVIQGSDLAAMQPQNYVANSPQDNASAVATGLTPIDSAMFFETLPNAAYIVEVFAIIATDTDGDGGVADTGDVVTGWQLPSGSTRTRLLWGPTANEADFVSNSNSRTNLTATTLNTSAIRSYTLSLSLSTPQVIWEKGIVRCGPTPGRVQFSFGHFVVNAGGRLVRSENSFMRVTRFA